MENIIYGRNPVLEALKSGRQIDRLWIQKGASGSIGQIESKARAAGLPVQYVDKAALDRLCGSGGHQGAAASVSAHAYCQVEDLLERASSRGEEPFLVLLDGVEDPHNLGAILRTADGAGAHGLILPQRRAAGLTQTVAKVSAGAIEYVPVARTVNLARTIDGLKEAGLWIAACDMDGGPYYEADLKGPIALVVGGEGRGVSRLVKEKCDFVLSIPMAGSVSSLNASNAAAVLMYEIRRQRATL
ncbi:MAG: 23S rRNA (guanosine(2251)-2'-O)-methyltransferase RlmB [Bacillota bacterium]|nr:23S rRNA (guanosine(2251)-2'-O)-methyltransferase RlmB [Bacillota bacterium]